MGNPKSKTCSKKEPTKAEKVLKVLQNAFPTVQSFNELEYIVAVHGFRSQQELGLDDDEAEAYICMLQELKWIKEAIFYS